MNHSYHTRLMAVVVAVGALAPVAWAGPKGPRSGGGDELPKFAEVTKDMEVKEGFFTLYYDKKKDVLLARIPKSMLNEPFLVGVSIPKGPMFAGWMLGESAVYWKRMNNKLVLMESETRFERPKNNPIQDVVKRTYTDSILRAMDIKTEAPGGDPVIDLGDLLKKDLVGLGRFYGGRRLDSSLSRWSTMKAFPHNVEIAVDAALMGGRGQGIIASLHLSLSRLPKNAYKPREADDRIGYFLTVKKDWASDHTAKTIFKRYINRWNLEKQDSDADLSPVKEPIVFYIEKTVPIKFRRWVREAILDWNKAFEKVGFLDAVQVRQQTETNEFKDLDPEDVRYNFFRWIVSGRAFAMGPSRVNPFTGQILDADIIMDDSMARYYVHDYQLMAPKGYNALYDPLADEIYAKLPELRYLPAEERLTPKFSAGIYLGENEPIEQHLNAFTIPSLHEAMRCQLGEGMVQQMAFAQLVHAQAGGGDLPEEYVGQLIKEVVMHEVGHTLGLRHNFKASAWLPLSEIISSDRDERPLVGSVMDYNPAEYRETREQQGNFITRTIGPYDYWAIEYGYRPFKATDDYKSEKEMLAHIARRCAEAGLAYATDEDTSDFGPDPYVNRYDNGDDPVTFAKFRMKMVDWLKKSLVDRAVEDGESYYRLRRAFNIMLGEYSLATRFAARMVGGQSVTRAHKGDPDAPPPFTMVPVAKQREALEFLGKTVFAGEAFDFSGDLLSKLAPGRFLHWDSDQMTFSVDYNLHDRVLAIQARVLTLLINPFTINRIYDAELKVPKGEKALTVHELVNNLVSMIWSELDSGTSGSWTNRKPMISSFRRNLQREHLRRMIAILLRPPGEVYNADAHAVVRLALKDLGKRIDGVLEKSRTRLDTYTLAHLDDSSNRISKALEAEFMQDSGH